MNTINTHNLAMQFLRHVAGALFYINNDGVIVLHVLVNGNRYYVSNYSKLTEGELLNHCIDLVVDNR